MGKSLFEITGDMLTVLDWATDPEMDEEAVLTTIESIQFELDQKAEGYCKVLKMLEHDKSAIAAEIAILERKAEIIENRRERLKTAIYEAMKALEITELPAGNYKFKIQKNGGKQAMKCDNDKVPDSFCKVEIKPDTAKIRKALEDGQQLDFAELLPRGESLRIK